ncbi:MAG: hypothetical protein QOG53_179 [Frankiales bacterium]|jgi:hypothetical protein|nr:hypothetical protein [Frankiales bacterium]
MLEQSARLLEHRTGATVPEWCERISAAGLTNEMELRSWLEEQGVAGYPQQLLVHETFGYPDFLTAGADELIEGQYADRPELRPILDAVLEAALGTGIVTVQARKGFVSLVTPKRKFAIVKAAAKHRVDLLLRIEREPGGGRLEPLNPDNNNDMNLRVGLQAVSDVDSDVRHWMLRAYRANL